MKIIIVLLFGAAWVLLNPASFNVAAGVAVIALGAAVITRGHDG